MSASNPAVRGAAIELAAAGGDPSVAALIDVAVADSSPLVRGGGAAALAFSPGEATIARLSEMMNDSDAWVRGKATAALGNMGAESAGVLIPILISGIESGDPEVVAGGVSALGGLGQVQLRGLVLDKLRFPDAFVRVAAMWAAAELADQGDPRDVLSGVAGLLRDQDMHVRLEAARLLGGFASETSVISLANVVNDPSLEMRLEAIRQLGNTGMPSVFSVLMTLVEDPLLAARLAAIDAMRPMASPAFLPDLESALTRAPDAETAAAINSLIVQIQTGG
jgi:HEAT repeat protein